MDAGLCCFLSLARTSQPVKPAPWELLHSPDPLPCMFRAGERPSAASAEDRNLLGLWLGLLSFLVPTLHYLVLPGPVRLWFIFLKSSSRHHFCMHLSPSECLVNLYETRQSRGKGRKREGMRKAVLLGHLTNRLGWEMVCLSHLDVQYSGLFSSNIQK